MCHNQVSLMGFFMPFIKHCFSMVYEIFYAFCKTLLQYFFSIFALSAVGDLTKFSHCHDHHVAKHGFDCDLFTPDSRPHCIQDHYVLSETSPSKIMRGADMYRKDGLCTSRLFKLWPVALNEPKISSPDFNLPRRVRVKFTSLRNSPHPIKIRANVEYHIEKKLCFSFWMEENI